MDEPAVVVRSLGPHLPVIDVIVRRTPIDLDIFAAAMTAERVHKETSYTLVLINAQGLEDWDARHKVGDPLYVLDRVVDRRTIRIAVALPFADRGYDLARQAILAGRRHGYLIEEFDDPIDALAWLMQDR